MILADRNSPEAAIWQLVESFEPGWRALDAELLKGWRHVPGWVFPA